MMRTLSVAAAAPETVKVWDPFVRVFHWSLVTAFFGAYFIEGGDNAHQVLGYVALGLIIARIVWGFIGSKYARFAQFVPSPRRLLAYAREAIGRRDEKVMGTCYSAVAAGIAAGKSRHVT